MLDMIYSIGYNIELSWQWWSIPFPYSVIVDVVSDADWIDALGSCGIQWCLDYGQWIEWTDSTEHI